MSRVSKMSLNEILSTTDLILRDNDIMYFCENIDVVKEFMTKYNKKTDKPEEVRDFFVRNEKYIHKEELVLLIVKNYTDNLKMLSGKIKQLKKDLSIGNTAEKLAELSKLQAKYDTQQDRLAKAKKIGKGIDTILTFYSYNEKEKRYTIDVVDSRELIDGKIINSSKTLRRFDEIDLAFKNGNPEEELGLEFIIQAVLLTDLYRVFPTEKIGNDIRTMILENEILKQGIKTQEQLQEMKTLENYEKYIELLDNVYFGGMLPDIKNTLREYCQYLDLDKLLLISAYRLNEALENDYISKDTALGAKDILRGILQSIKNSNIQISCELQRKIDGSYEMELVEYSTRDLRKCLTQFTTAEYLTQKEIEEYREKISNKEIDLWKLGSEKTNIIFTTEELESLSVLSIENLLYVFKELKWDTSKVIELYETSLISLEDIRQIKEYIDLSGNISFESLNSYYKYIKENTEDEEAKAKYQNYLNLYKEILLTDKPEEEMQRISNMVIEGIIESFSEKDYNEAIKRYFRDGIINLESIADWSNDNIITELFEEGLISLSDMEELVRKQKMPFEELSNIYSKLIKDDNIEYDERIKLIKSGFVKEDDIFDLYKRNLLFEEDLRKLAEEELVRKDLMERIINSRTMEELERNSSIRLTGLNNLTKKNNDAYYYGSAYLSTVERRATGKFIIDPEKREKFIKLLKAYRADTDLTEDSPFYNYEFYVTPDESGTIGLNSVVIAERYFEDKDTETRFATENATYFFKYKDLMVLSNLRKSEMTRERTNIVFTANHVLAKDDREGRWAKSVITNFVRTMLSSDLREYSKKNQRIIIEQKLKELYSNQELAEILGLATEIDLGEYICEIEEAVDNSRRNTSSRRKRKSKSILDDDECR